MRCQNSQIFKLNLIIQQNSDKHNKNQAQEKKLLLAFFNCKSRKRIFQKLNKLIKYSKNHHSFCKLSSVACYISRIHINMVESKELISKSASSENLDDIQSVIYVKVKKVGAKFSILFFYFSQETQESRITQSSENKHSVQIESGETFFISSGENSSINISTILLINSIIRKAFSLHIHDMLNQRLFKKRHKRFKNKIGLNKEAIDYFENFDISQMNITQVRMVQFIPQAAFIVEEYPESILKISNVQQLRKRSVLKLFAAFQLIKPGKKRR